MMQRWVFLVASGMVILISIRYLIPVVRIDGFWGVVGSILLPEDTEYAQGYNHSAFLTVRKGMSADEVYQLLGPAISSSQRGDIMRRFYSRSPSSSHYRIREVRSMNGKVVDVNGYYYVD